MVETRDMCNIKNIKKENLRPDKRHGWLGRSTCYNRLVTQIPSYEFMVEGEN